MKDVILLVIGFACGGVFTSLFEAKINAFIVRLLTKTASKIGNKN